MVIREREFYRSARGPTPNDEDAWRLVFDPVPGNSWFATNGKLPDTTG